MTTTDCTQKTFDLLPSDSIPLGPEHSDTQLPDSLSNSSDLAGQEAGHEGSPSMSTDSPRLGQTAELGAYPTDLGFQIIPNGEAFARQLASQVIQAQHEYELRASTGLSTPRMADNFANLVFHRSPGRIAQPQSPQVNDSLPQYYYHLQGLPFEQRDSIKARQRVSQACDPCRRRKAKCSGGRPSCKRCIERNLSCGYAEAQSRVRGKSKKPDDRDPSESSSEGHASSTLPGRDLLDNASNQGAGQGSVVRGPRKKNRKQASILPYTYKPVYHHISPSASHHTGLYALDGSSQDHRYDSADYWPFMHHSKATSGVSVDASAPVIPSLLPPQVPFDSLASLAMSALFDHVPAGTSSDLNYIYASSHSNGHPNPSDQLQGSVLASSSTPVDPQSPCPDIQDIFYTIAAPRPSLPLLSLGFPIDSPSVFCPSPDFAHSTTTTESSSSTGSPFSVAGTLPGVAAEVSAVGGNAVDQCLVQGNQGIDSGTEESFVKLLTNSPLFPCT